ncbi:MAG: M43 family zinc metalloprotease [Bacteroidetes bacterium]|nr:M43 family zinc metalloprotease [Bacteroidota bacterium]
MKSKYLKFALLSTIVCFSQLRTVKAQTVMPCGTVEKNEELYLQHPELKQAYIDYVNDLNQKINQKTGKSTTIYTIPMVFHVIHVNGTENIPDANIIAQVARLNTDYRKLNTDITSAPPYFQSIAGDVKIQFKLAQIDPNGNCTNGIDRIYSHRTFNADDNSKLNQWPRDKYFNVWVITNIPSGATAGTILAYATFPSSVASFGYPSDGVIMISTECNGTSRTLSHETGHWLSLEHTWGNTTVATACGDDGVIDTPVTKGHFSTCPSVDFSCDLATLSGAYAFSGVTTASGSSDPTAAPYVTDSTVAFTHFNATGVSANSSTAAKFDFSNWDTGAIDGDTSYASLSGAINLGKYYEFTVTPDPNVAMTLSSISFDFQRNTDGVRTYVVRSSADGYTSNLAASIAPANANLSVKTGNIFYSKFDTTINLVGSKITLSGASFTGTSSPITFRIYGYNAESATGTFGIDNLSIAGTFGDAENINNYMDYSSCIFMFTQGQVDRMRAALESPVAQRSSLWLNSNLIATGTDGTVYPPCTPEPDLYANKYMICPGSTVTFTKNVLNVSSGTTTTYAWSFPGGSPATSTAASPTVTYSTPGSYDVTLTATNAGGTGTITKNLFVHVSDAFAQVPNTYSENFENSTEYFSHWYSKDLDNNSKTWWLNSNAGYNSSNSVVMNSYGNYAYDVDQLYSPSFDLTYITSPVLTFRCAAATKATSAADMNDKLTIYSSIDCGATWNTRKVFSGTSFLNNSYHPEEFVPSSPSQWALQTVTIPGTVATANTRFKFEYTSGNAGNSIFIDDVNITGVLGINENNIEDANVSIYPNPTAQTATISYYLNKKGDTKIELMDILGKKLMEINNNNQLEGDHSIQISKHELNLINGIYFVKLTIDNTTITKKLIITE